MIQKYDDRRVCWIIGAGPCSGLEKEGFAPKQEDYIIAADGGLRYLQEAGVAPDLIVGDFDTLGYAPACENVVHLPVEKDWTDTFVSIEKGVEAGYETFVFFGCLGGKLEHTIANLQHLNWLARRGLTGWMTDGRVWATAICGSGAKPARLALPARDSGTVSVFSLEGTASGVSICGLKYGIYDGELSAGFPLGVSNEFIGKSAEVSVGEGVLLIVEEA